MSFPVTSFTVNPSRFTCAKDTPRLTLSPTTGPDAPPRTAHDPWLPNGTESVPVHFVSDGRLLGDVHQPAQRVPAEQRALRTAHELDLIDVEQLDARGVRAELRDAVDVGRDARVVRAGADAAEPGVAQLSAPSTP